MSDVPVAFMADMAFPRVAPSQKGSVRINPKQLGALCGAYRSIILQVKLGHQWPRITVDDLVELGEQHIRELQIRVEQKTGIKFDISIDCATNSVTFRPLMPEEIVEEDEVSLSAPSPPTATKGKAGKIPRPANAFILYRQHWHPTIKAENPGLHNNDISVILGNKWRKEDEHVRAEFKAKADEAKKQHAIDHPEYQYQPRKPSEKKRRMTKNKRAKLAAANLNDQGLAQQQDLPDFDPTSLFDAAINTIQLPQHSGDFEFTNFYEPYTAPTNSIAIAQTGDAIGFHASPVSNEVLIQAVQDFNEAFAFNARTQHSAAAISTAAVVDGASYDHHPHVKHLPVEGIEVFRERPLLHVNVLPNAEVDVSAPDFVNDPPASNTEVQRQNSVEGAYTGGMGGSELCFDDFVSYD